MAMTPRDRRAIAIGLAILVPALVWIWGVRPWWSALGDARARLAVERAALARERALLAEAPRAAGVRRAVDSLRARDTARLVDARDDAVAGGQLAAYVADLARRHDVLLQEADGRPGAITPAGLRAVRVDLRAESDFQGIVDLLRALERGSKLVRVDAVTITGASDADARDAGVVRLRASIVGYAASTLPPVPPDGGTPRSRPSAAAGEVR